MRRLLRLLPALLVCAAAAHAGTVYVPLPGTTAVGANSYQTQVLVANESALRKSAKALLIPAETDGTDRDGAAPSTVTVSARRGVVFRPTAGQAGLLELDGPADFRYTARLLGATADLAGEPLPVIGSWNLTAAGERSTVQGLRASLDGSRTAHLGIVNLGHEDASCSVQVLRTSGAAVVSAATVALAPLTQRLFQVGVGLDLADARAVVECDEDFFAWGFLQHPAIGDFTPLFPAAPGSSALVPPGADAGCAAGAECYEVKGLVHQPSKSVPVGRVSFPAKKMTAKRFRLTMDVTVANFFQADPDAKHLIYWFVINNNKDMPGMLYFRGPAAYTALARHGIGLTHPQKKKLVDENFSAEVGATYRVVNDYDMGRGVYRITITDLGTGKVESTLVGVPNVTKYELDTADRIIVDMAFPEGKVPDEVPSYNWRYSNLRVEVFR
jgi:hypothetical protein